MDEYILALPEIFAADDRLSDEQKKEVVKQCVLDARRDLKTVATFVSTESGMDFKSSVSEQMRLCAMAEYFDSLTRQMGQELGFDSDTLDRQSKIIKSGLSPALEVSAKPNSSEYQIAVSPFKSMTVELDPVRGYVDSPTLTLKGINVVYDNKMQTVPIFPVDQGYEAAETMYMDNFRHNLRQAGLDIDITRPMPEAKAAIHAAKQLRSQDPSQDEVGIGKFIGKYFVADAKARETYDFESMAEVREAIYDSMYMMDWSLFIEPQATATGVVVQQYSDDLPEDRKVSLFTNGSNFDTTLWYLASESPDLDQSTKDEINRGINSAVDLSPIDTAHRDEILATMRSISPENFGRDENSFSIA